MAENYASSIYKKLLANIKTVIKGKDKEISFFLAAVLCGGHVLIEDVPGTGKTVLCKALAQSLDFSFSRLQCTSDLLPGDITGIDIFDPAERKFKFQPGPIFSNVVLADEINRATPKTQSALLECMSESQATIGRNTYLMPNPFIVLATQNPIEFQGTFPLPEAQLDRFLIKMSIGYPSAEAEVLMLKSQLSEHPLDKLEPCASKDMFIKAREAIRQVAVADCLHEYITAIVRQTRAEASVLLGASPRGSQALSLYSRAIASVQGRMNVLPDDIKLAAPFVLRHRIISNSANPEEIINNILNSVPVPI
ncbi:MAG: MoxR family ATPase [bacterium]|nr:MoxR family ATPase [bacterium]